MSNYSGGKQKELGWSEEERGVTHEKTQLAERRVIIIP